MEETVTESESVESTELVDTPEETVNTIDDMSDEAFDEAFENDDFTEDDTETDNAPKEELTDEDLYRKQLDDTDAKLDTPVLLKHAGTVMKVDNLNELRNLAEKGFNATQKFQKLSEDRKALEAQLEALGQTPDVAPDNTLVDDVDAVAADILHSDYADDFTRDVQALDDATKRELGSNAEMLKGLSIDYQSGLAKAIMPQVHKLMKVNGMSFLDAYSTAGKSYNDRQNKQADPKVNVLKAEPKQSVKVSTSGQSAIDNMSDAEFERYFADI